MLLLEPALDIKAARDLVSATLHHRAIESSDRIKTRSHCHSYRRAVFSTASGLSFSNVLSVRVLRDTMLALHLECRIDFTLTGDLKMCVSILADSH